MTRSSTAPGWDAEDYAEHSSGQERWALDNFSRLPVNDSDYVLDVGCGDGKVTAAIAARVHNGHVTGIDFSADMIRHARENYGKLPNVAFEQMDAANIQLERRYDWVFSNSTLHWVNDHPAILRGIARCLRPKGRFFLSMGGRGTISAVTATVADYISRKNEWGAHLVKVRSPMTYSSPEQYQEWLPESGLVANDMQLRARPLLQADRAALKGWLRTTKMYYINAIPESRQEVFLEEFTEDVLRRCDRTEEGQILVPMVNLEVSGIKPG